MFGFTICCISTVILQHVTYVLLMPWTKKTSIIQHNVPLCHTFCRIDNPVAYYSSFSMDVPCVETIQFHIISVVLKERLSDSKNCFSFIISVPAGASGPTGSESRSAPSPARSGRVNAACTWRRRVWTWYHPDPTKLEHSAKQMGKP